MKITIVIFVALVATPALAMPPWAKSATQSLSGTTYSVVCSGAGPTLDLARREALDNCDLAAIRQLSPEVRVTTMSIETERDVGFHSEVATENVFHGLTCQPKREELEGQAGNYTVWLQCQYDLAVARKASADSSARPKRQSPGGAVSNAEETSVVTVRPERPKTQRDGVERPTTLSIASVPECSSILVRGQAPRVIPCDANPMTLTVNPEDREVIVRAKGYQPKHLLLNSAFNGDDYVTVTLEADR